MAMAEDGPTADREYEGPALDGTYQHLTERPYGGEGETVAVTGEAEGEVSTEGVPLPPDPDELEAGQSTLDDWGWSVDP